MFRHRVKPREKIDSLHIQRTFKFYLIVHAQNCLTSSYPGKSIPLLCNKLVITWARVQHARYWHTTNYHACQYLACCTCVHVITNTWLLLPILAVFYHSLRLTPRCPATTLVTLPVRIWWPLSGHAGAELHTKFWNQYPEFRSHDWPAAAQKTILTTDHHSITV